MLQRLAMGLVLALLMSTWTMVAIAADEYLSGGPLAGLKLPLYPTQHGEEQGHPGVIPGKFEKDGLAPELELYPGSVEHYRAYMDKYLPVRSMFDKQTQLKNWQASMIEGVNREQVENYASPVYYVARHGGRGTVDTGLRNKPVPVVRAKVKAPVFKLDLGELDVGLYAVRIIGAVETKNMRPFRLPLFVTMKVNDGIKGEVSAYRIRLGYVDEFYSVAEIYFHAVEKRGFKAELFVDEGSQVDLLIHNITLDDVLAGTIRKPLKVGTTLHSPESLKEMADQGNGGRIPPTLDKEARWARDRSIWRVFPPLNKQGGGSTQGVTAGVADLNAQQIEEQHGKWEPVHTYYTGPVSAARFMPLGNMQEMFLVNKKLGLNYSLDDLEAGKSLPDPYPFKDDGAGLYFPNANQPASGRMWSPIAGEVARLHNAYRYLAGNGAGMWRRTGSEEWARDGAIALIRYAYQFPALDSANMLPWIVHEQGPAYASDPRCRKRQTQINWHSYMDFLAVLYWYDLLYDYIKGNEDLAQSVRRFVPWVKNSNDLLMLLDVYLLQIEAKRVLRYHDMGDATSIAVVAAALGDAKVAQPWMEFQMDRVFEYPNKPAGVLDIMISNTDRLGCLTIGSTSYAYQGAIPQTEQLDQYIRAVGGADQFDMRRYSSKPGDHQEWTLGITVAGGEFPRIGDVGGPDKSPWLLMKNVLGNSFQAWEWTGDPRYAWIVMNMRGGAPAQAARRLAAKPAANLKNPPMEIDKAAATIKRAPWLDLRSRVLPNWFAVLESGLQHDDYRFRRAVYVRSGMGVGHEHFDTFDLQGFMHGLPFTIDGGQRSGYSKPNDRFTRTHNLVEVLGDSLEGYGHPNLYSWTQSLSDAQGARYMNLMASPPPAAKFYNRQVAMVDVDEGQGSQPLSVEQQRPDSALPRNVVTANSYVFDVFRVSGGKIHTYGFHGPVNDDFQWTAKNVQPVAGTQTTKKTQTEADYLSIFEMAKDTHMAGDAPDVLQATWQYRRENYQNNRAVGSEQQMLGKNYDPKSPRKFTRLHLMDASGLRALRADVVCYKDPIQYQFTHMMAQKRGENLESAFPAIIEPYVDKPFITAVKLLNIEGNQADAKRAVAVEVATKQGQLDVCFADGQPEQTRKVRDLTIRGEFAFYSTDDKGLRQASLTGGSTLESPSLRLTVSQPQRQAKVTRVDYANKTMWIDAAWPASAIDTAFVVGSDKKLTTYMATDMTPEGSGTKIVMRHGADFYRSRVENVQPDGTVITVLEFPCGSKKGMMEDWVASNEAQTKFWRAEYLGGSQFKLQGKVAKEDFAPQGVLRLWEYGVGDTVQQKTWASVRRIEPDVYEITGNASLTLAFKGKTGTVSSDRKAWKPSDGNIAIESLTAGPVYIKLQP